MANHQRILVLAGALWLATGTATGADRLRLRVRPAVALAPGFVTVEASIEADAENRSLEIAAEGADFYRSSQIPLNGANAPRRSVVEFRNLPSGIYQVSAVLMGAQGPRASVLRMIKVTPTGATR